MMQSRGVTDGGGPEVEGQRKELYQELRDIMRRLDVIKAIGVATSGTAQGESNV